MSTKKFFVGIVAAAALAGGAAAGCAGPAQADQKALDVVAPSITCSAATFINTNDFPVMVSHGTANSGDIDTMRVNGGESITIDTHNNEHFWWATNRLDVPDNTLLSSGPTLPEQHGLNTRALC